jgi:hypothetical protein
MFFWQILKIDSQGYVGNFETVSANLLWPSARATILKLRITKLSYLNGEDGIRAYPFR